MFHYILQTLGAVQETGLHFVGGHFLISPNQFKTLSALLTKCLLPPAGVVFQRARGAGDPAEPARSVLAEDGQQQQQQQLQQQQRLGPAGGGRGRRLCVQRPRRPQRHTRGRHSQGQTSVGTPREVIFKVILQ